MLCSFVEGPITFAPTYKFSVGCDTYSAKRIPAWCDRVLWVSPVHPAVSVKQNVYTSASMTPSWSDHRPVFSEFRVAHNRCWSPRPRSQWMVTMHSLRLFLLTPSLATPSASSPVNVNDDLSSTAAVIGSRRHRDRHHRSRGTMGSSLQSADLSVTHIRDSTSLVAPYLTLHSPMLATNMRTTTGQR